MIVCSQSVWIAGFPKTASDKQTGYQDLWCGILSLESIGYFGTSPDGNCLFNALSQARSNVSSAQIHDHPGLGQDEHAQLRHLTAVQLQSNQEFSAILENSALHVCSKYEGLANQWKVAQTGPCPATCAALLASRIQHDKVWVGSWVAQAAALALHRDIIEIQPGRMLLHTKTMDRGGRSFDQESGILYPRAASRKRNTTRKDLPVEALHPATLFVIWNGKDHFWAALRRGAPPSRAAIKKKGFTVDDVVKS